MAKTSSTVVNVAEVRVKVEAAGFTVQKPSSQGKAATSIKGFSSIVGTRKKPLVIKY